MARAWRGPRLILSWMRSPCKTSEGVRSDQSRAITVGAKGKSSFFFQAEAGIRAYKVTGVQTCALPIRIVLPSLVLYEWFRGPRLPQELSAQEALFPSETAIPFGWQEAALSAKLYRSLDRARGREIDLAIAACAITHEAALWTLNIADFKDIPGLRFYNSI